MWRERRQILVQFRTAIEKTNDVLKYPHPPMFFWGVYIRKRYSCICRVSHPDYSGSRRCWNGVCDSDREGCRHQGAHWRCCSSYVHRSRPQEASERDFRFVPDKGGPDCFAVRQLNPVATRSICVRHMVVEGAGVPPVQCHSVRMLRRLGQARKAMRVMVLKTVYTYGLRS